MQYVTYYIFMRDKPIPVHRVDIAKGLEWAEQNPMPPSKLFDNVFDATVYMAASKLLMLPATESEELAEWYGKLADEILYIDYDEFIDELPSPYYRCRICGFKADNYNDILQHIKSEL